MVHKGRNALGAIKPSFREAITIVVGDVAETHGQPRVELLGEPAGQETGQYEMEQSVAEVRLFVGGTPFGRQEVGSGEKRVHERYLGWVQPVVKRESNGVF